jgi:hypothetical protein
MKRNLENQEINYEHLFSIIKIIRKTIEELNEKIKEIEELLQCD